MYDPLFVVSDVSIKKFLPHEVFALKVFSNIRKNPNLHSDTNVTKCVHFMPFVRNSAHFELHKH